MVICTYAHCVMYAYKVLRSSLQRFKRSYAYNNNKKQDRRTGQKNNTTCIFVARGIINVFEGFQKQDRMMIKKKKEKEEEEIPFFSVELDLSLPFLFPFPCVDFVCSSLVSALPFWVFVSFFSFLLSLRSLFSHPFSVLLFFVSFSSLVSSSGCFSSSVSVLSDIFGSFFFSVTHRMHL